MRRQDIKLLALARSGDAQARCEVGRRYLSGTDGFRRQLGSGIEYLSHPSVAGLPQACRSIADCMTLDEIVQARLTGMLQRAAAAGVAVAQAKLGAWWLARHAGAAAGTSLLQAAADQGHAAAKAAIDAWRAASLSESEQALGRLHLAAQQGDEQARRLLRAWVRPLEGEARDAQEATAAVARHDARLAARLRIARSFGLARREALCFDPVSGLRPWGLVVGADPSIGPIGVSPPRAIPAPTREAQAQLRAAAELFARRGAEVGRDEGDLDGRSRKQRRLFARLGLDEAMFFAAGSTARPGSPPRGRARAFGLRQPLGTALAV